MPQAAKPVIPVAQRVQGVSYAIRNIVAEAKKVEATGRRVRYLNIGDPIQFGFKTPAHLIAAVERALEEGDNGYAPSAGLGSARAAAAADYVARGVPMVADRVVITYGTSEGIELTLNVLVDPGDDVLVPSPTYPMYTAVLAKLGARPSYYRCDPTSWLPDIEHIKSRLTPRTKALVVIDPNNPTGAIYPPDVRRQLLELADRHNLPVIADEVYGDLGHDGPVAPISTVYPGAPVISFSSMSKAFLAPGWRAGWLMVGDDRRLDDVLNAIKKLADGRLCAPAPMQHAITVALTTDRSHQAVFRAALKERAELTTTRLNAIPGIRCVPPRAAFYAMPQVTLPPGKTDADFVLGLLRSKGILCVYGSGFGLDPAAGALRIVFLASPAELSGIYDDLAAFAVDFLAQP